MLEWLEKICVIVCRMKKAALKTYCVVALNCDRQALKRIDFSSGHPWIQSNGVQDLTESGVPCC